MNETPIISVVMPCFNSEKYLREALQSYLANAFAGVELVVVDDGSTDRSVQIAKETVPDCVLIQQQHQGPAPARNRGLEAARGEFVTFLDSDDLWPEGTLARLLESQRSSSARIAQGMVETFACGEVAPAMRARLKDEPFYSVSLGSALFYREDLRELNGFDETLAFGEDTDLWIRCWEKGIEKTLLPEVTLCYRLHDANMTIQSASDPRTLLRVMKRHRDRMQGRSPVAAVSLTSYLGSVQK